MRLRGEAVEIYSTTSHHLDPLAASNQFFFLFDLTIFTISKKLTRSPSDQLSVYMTLIQLGSDIPAPANEVQKIGETSKLERRKGKGLVFDEMPNERQALLKSLQS